MEYAYSHDREVFHGEFASVAEALKEALEVRPGKECWIGEIQAIPASRYVNADVVIDGAMDMAYQEMGEIAEDYLADLSDEATKELDAALSAWAAKYARPSFWDVVNIKAVAPGADASAGDA